MYEENQPDAEKNCDDCRNFEFNNYYKFDNVYVVPYTEHDCGGRYPGDEDYGCCHKRYATIIPNIFEYINPDKEYYGIRFTIKYNGDCLCQDNWRIN